ncbi:NAD(P)(+) transhydrogenase (Re/Si-specific) subunit beta, partial [Serpentinicella alkaliphila]
MEPLVYYIICAFLSITVLIGIALMSKVKTAIIGNILSSVATLIAIIVTLLYFGILSDKWTIYTIFVCLFVGSIIGLILAQKVKMIQMPQLVATLNGVGGAASALVGGAAIFSANATFELATATLALFVGTLTFTGSLIAAGKLANIIDGRPVVWKGHTALMSTSISLLLFILIAFLFFNPPMLLTTIVAIFMSAFLGIGIAIRVGGADMPITISLLNSFSGVAAAIAGLAINDILLVSIGGIVGSSGLLLTQIMCKSMNSSLSKILQGKTSVSKVVHNEEKKAEDVGHVNEKSKEVPVEEILRSAKKAIIVPGYGMAIAQAQHLVKQLADILECNGCEVKYAIHPVAGRMPGHMNVLLAEADVSYEQ